MDKSILKKRLLSCSLHVVFISLVVSVTSAQITTVDDTTSTPVEGVGHDYIKMLSETVNPANGSVSLRIQLPTAKGRGITLPFTIAYDTQGINFLTTWIDQYQGGASWSNNFSYLSQGGWSYSLPMRSFSQWVEQEGQYPNWINCTATSSFVFTDLTGARHSLPVGWMNPGVPYGCLDANQTAYSGGDSQVQLKTTGAFSTADGTVYNFSAAPTHSGYSGNPNANFALPTTIEDRNGNVITFNDSSNNSGVFSIADTAGRTEISSNGFGPANTTNTLTIDGQTYQITWTSTSANYNISPSNPVFVSNSSCNFANASSYTEPVISSITLPNGSQYKFYYGTDNPNPSFQNPYGLLSEIDYPDGGSVKYKWKPSDTFSELANFPAANCIGSPSYCQFFPNIPVMNGCLYQYNSVVVGARYVSFGNSQTSLTQTFTYHTNWNSAPNAYTWSTKTTTVSSLDAVTGNSSQTIYTYSATTGPPIPFITTYPPEIPLEQQIQYYALNSTTNVLKTVNKTWLDMFDLKNVQTVIPTGPNTTESTTTNYVYSTSTGFSQLLEKDEFDYGATTATRRTMTAYQQFLGTPGIIADEPCKTVVYDSTGKPAAETDYLYDGGSVACGAPGVPSVSSAGGPSLTGHDATNFSSGSTISRGNVTGKLRRLFGGQSPLTKYAYDETGQVTAITDPNGNATQYSYADQFLSTNTGSFTTTGGAPPSGSVTNAFLTTVTHPSANGMNLTEHYTYGYNNGELTTATDANQQVTTYRYDDLLSRPTQVVDPDTGSTSSCYTDVGGPTCSRASSPPYAVVTTKAINAVTSMQSIAVMDGMEHTVQNQLTTDPDGTTTTDLTYTGLGQLLSRSNPHRTGPSATDGITSYLYDGLGRTCLVIPPGGTGATSCPTSPQAGDEVTIYSGNCATVFDGAGKSRTSCTDALGRLTGVWEDPSGLNYETDYQYNALDDLVSVTQKGGSTQANWRVRSFLYDSLSRLLSATNPESGTIQYSYDLNGNVMSKTDARGIQTTMQYDALNRLLSKTYSDGTPTATFYYDTPPAPWATGEQNTKGRLVESTTGITPEP